MSTLTMFKNFENNIFIYLLVLIFFNHGRELI